MTKGMIINDLRNCGLSQWFNKQGLCSVFDNCGDGYDLVISTGTSLRQGEIIESYKDLSLDEVMQKTKGG